MRVVIPHEHGAWMMWLAPLAVGMAVTPWHPAKLLLVGAVLFAYLGSYPLLQLLRHPEQRQLWLGWAVGYGTVAIAFALPLLLMRPVLLLVGVMAVGALAVNAWFAYQRQERNLLNDFVAMAGLSLSVVAAYAVGAEQIDATAWGLWGLCVLYFFGTALHVKSLIRERRNRLLKITAVLYALALSSLLALTVHPYLGIGQLPATLRTMVIPQNHRFKAIVLGVIEIICTVWFAVWLALWANTVDKTPPNPP